MFARSFWHISHGEYERNQIFMFHVEIIYLPVYSWILFQRYVRQIAMHAYDINFRKSHSVNRASDLFTHSLDNNIRCI